MPFVDTPNVVQCEVLAALDGQVIENRIMVNTLHQPVAADLTGLQAQFANWINLNYSLRLPVECVINQLKFTSLDARNRIQLIVPLNVPGAVTGGAMPNEVSYCVSLKSNVVGRSARGRFYVMALAKSNVSTQNRVGSAYRTAITADVDSLRTRIGSIGFLPVIVSYRTNNAPRVGGPVYFTWTTSSTFDDIVDSQRRRRPGIGS